jgi:hypothetical protein
MPQPLRSVGKFTCQFFLIFSLPVIRGKLRRVDSHDHRAGLLRSHTVFFPRLTRGPVRRTATSASATFGCLRVTMPFSFFSALLWWPSRGPPPCARQVWRGRCFAAADCRDTPPLEGTRMRTFVRECQLPSQHGVDGFPVLAGTPGFSEVSQWEP